MRKAIAALFVIVLVASAWPAVALAQKPRAERPTYELGDTWSRNDGLYELTRVEPDRYVFTAGGNREIQLSKDLAIMRSAGGSSWVEMSPPLQIKWPLEVGRWGVQTSRWRSHNGPAGVELRLSYEVKAYEDVTPYASKTLKAFKVEFEARTTQSLGPQFTRAWTAWYAPEAQQWVKGEAPPNTMPMANYTVFDVTAIAPLVVQLEQPADQERVTGTTSRVLGRVRARKGVVAVNVTVNGVEAYSLSPVGAPREIRFNESLALKEGKNTVLVTVTDRAGERQQEARTVFWEKASVVASAPPSGVPLVTEPPAPTPEPSVAAPPTPVVAAPAPKPEPPPVVAAVPPPAAPVAPAPPLVVRLSSPVDKAKVEHETIALAGVASGGKGITRVAVTVNGLEVHKHDERSPARALPLNMALKLREGANIVVVTVTDADGLLEQETRVVSYERPVPFTISFRFPEERARVTEEASVVAAMVESSAGITSARILVNGTEVHQQSERAPQRSLLVSAPVILRDGPNAIVVAATQSDGTVRQEIRTVVFDRPKVAAVPAPAAPAAPAIPLPERWAVIIGVGKYESAAIPGLRFSVPDAEAIYNTLTGPAGFKKSNVLMLTDRSERKPTLRNIKWALGTFLGRSARKEDTVLIFFAGHGAPEVDQRGVERDGLAKYLIPGDADPDDLYSTALPMDELQTIFGRIEAERVVAFIDACYSGAAGGRTFTAKATRASNLDDLFLERITRSKGRAIVTASRPSEVSLELAELGHGIFTYYLVRGLEGGADLNRDGIVTLQELYEYVEAQVTKKSRASGGNQHPVMKGEMEGVLPLTKVRK